MSSICSNFQWALNLRICFNPGGEAEVENLRSVIMQFIAVAFAHRIDVQLHVSIFNLSFMSFHVSNLLNNFCSSSAGKLHRQHHWSTITNVKKWSTVWVSERSLGDYCRRSYVYSCSVMQHMWIKYQITATREAVKNLISRWGRHSPAPRGKAHYKDTMIYKEHVFTW